MAKASKRHWKPYFVAGLIIIPFALSYFGWQYVQAHYNGKALAKLIMKGFNKNRRGKLEIESVYWKPRAVLDFLTGRSTHVTINNLKMYDVRGKLVVDIPLASGDIFIDPLKRNVSLVAENIECHKGKIVLEMFDSPDDPGSREIGLLGMIKSTKKDDDDDDTLGEHSWVVSAKGFNLSGIDLIVDIPALDMDIKGMSLKGGHIYFGTESQESPKKFHLQGRPTAKSAWTKLLSREHNFTDIKFVKAYMDPDAPMNLHFAITAKEGKSPVRAVAFLGNHGISVDVKSKNVAKMASRYIPLVNLTDGPDSAANIKIRGTLQAPRVYIEGKGLRFINPYGTNIDNLSGKLFFQRNDGYSTINFLDITGTTGDATLVGSGMWDLVTGNIYTQVKGVEINPREYLPASLHSKLPNMLNGKVSIRTVFPNILNVEFGWKMKGSGGVLGYLVSSGAMTYKDGSYMIKKFKMTTPELEVHSIGEIGKSHDLLLLTHIRGHNLHPVLKRLGIAPIINTMKFGGYVSGYLSSPRINGKATVGDINIKGISIPGITGQLAMNSKGASVYNAYGSIGGGSLSGHGNANWKNGLWVSAIVAGKHLKTSTVTSGLMSGKLNFTTNLRGHLNSLSGKIHVDYPHGIASGMKIKKGILDLKLKRGNINIEKGEVLLNNSKVAINGTMSKSQDLDIGFSIDGLRVRNPGPQYFTGFLNAKMKIIGNLSSPGFSGWVSLNESKIYKRKLPARALLSFFRKDEQNIIKGDLFSYMKINGKFDIRPSISTRLKFAFNNIRAKPFLPPKLLKNLGISVIGSGTGELLYSGSGLPLVSMKLTRLDSSLIGKYNPYIPSKPVKKLSLDKPATIQLSSKGVSVNNLKLLGNGTELNILAKYDFKNANIFLDGTAGLEYIPYLIEPGILDSVSGSVVSKLGISFGSSGVSINGDIYFAGNKFSLTDRTGDFTFRAGKLGFRKNKLDIKGVRVVYDEEEVVANGKVSLSPWVKPEKMAVNIHGRISSALLSLVREDVLYSTSGRALIDLDLDGDISNPDISGYLYLKEKNRLFLRSGRELALLPGSRVDFKGSDIMLSGVNIEMEDGVVLADGFFKWSDGRPVDTDIKIKLQNIVERSSSYEVEMMGKLNVFCKGREPLKLKGSIDLLNGSYTKKFNINLVDKLLSPVSRTSESSGSIFDSDNWISNIQLDLIVQLTGDIEVDNNLAQTKLEGVANVTGTLSSPKIGGIVTLNGGTFRIPMLRGSYEIKEGIIDFDKAKNVGHEKDEPFLDVTGEMVFIDRQQTEHIISLRIHGFVSQLKLHWSSSTGLNSSQVLMLLMLNRTPDEIRRGEGGGIPDLGGMLEGYVPLNLQLGLTSDSVKVFVDKKFLGDHVVLKGNVEVGFMGRQLQEAFLIFKFHDNFRIQSQARRKISTEETAVRNNDDELQGKVELKYKIKLKGSWKNMLGL